MDENSANFAKMARLLAFIHIITGVLLLVFGIADKLVQYKRQQEYGMDCHGIWTGIWLCITGCLGVPASGRKRNTFRNAFACVYMLFSIIAAVLGGIIAIIYSEEIYFTTSYGLQNSHNYHAKLAIIVIMLILDIATFWVGIWAAVCTCLVKPCSIHLRGRQRPYYNPDNGHVMMQLPGGVPVVIQCKQLAAGLQHRFPTNRWCYCFLLMPYGVSMKLFKKPFPKG